MWAEAAHREAPGDTLVLPEELRATAAVDQEERLEDDPWLEILADVHGDVAGGVERVSTQTVLKNNLAIEPGHQQQFHSKRLAALMGKLGWSGPKRLRMGDGKVTRGYERPTTDQPKPPLPGF